METDICLPLTLQMALPNLNLKPAAQPAPDTAHGHNATWTGLGYFETNSLHVSLNHADFLGNFLLSIYEQE